MKKQQLTMYMFTFENGEYKCAQGQLKSTDYYHKNRSNRGNVSCTCRQTYAVTTIMYAKRITDAMKNNVIRTP